MTDEKFSLKRFSPSEQLLELDFEPAVQKFESPYPPYPQAYGGAAAEKD